MAWVQAAIGASFASEHSIPSGVGTTNASTEVHHDDAGAGRGLASTSEVFGRREPSVVLVSEALLDSLG
jgi:hypothetical protein